ncbi:MAG: ABC transporter ATP-binding protein [Sphingobacteriaceae bacterium]
MINLQDVCKIYKNGRSNETVALKEINLKINAGEFVVVVGANGSGKSTLLNTIAGSVLPTSGVVFIDQRDVTRLPEFRRSRWVARVFQNPLSGTAPDLSILDNFRLAALRTTSKQLLVGINAAFKQQVRNSISRLGMGLEDKIDQQMGTLSGGQRQALTLLMAVMDNVNILLLDEPTAALDPRSAEIVMKTADSLIKDYKLTALLITHNLKEAFQYGDRLILMNDAKINKDLTGTAKSLLTQNMLYEWFM